MAPRATPPRGESGLLCADGKSRTDSCTYQQTRGAFETDGCDDDFGIFFMVWVAMFIWATAVAYTSIYKFGKRRARRNRTQTLARNRPHEAAHQIVEKGTKEI